MKKKRERIKLMDSEIKREWMSIKYAVYIDKIRTERFNRQRMKLDKWVPCHLEEANLEDMYTFLLWVRCDTRSIFEWSTASLNSEFSFSLTDCLTKAKEPIRRYNFPIAEKEDGWIHALWFSLIILWWLYRVHQL